LVKNPNLVPLKKQQIFMLFFFIWWKINCKTTLIFDSVQ
jgi:hypothetical protein